MARRRSRGRSAETNDFASSPTFENLERELLRPAEDLTSPLTEPFVESLLELPADRRQFSFGEWESPVMEPSSSRGWTRSPGSWTPVPVNIRAQDPRNVAVCVRRHDRREVLHALCRLGRGGGKRRRNEWSDVHCK